MTLHSRERYNCRRKALCVAACIFCLAQHMLLGLEFAKHKLGSYFHWHAFSFAIPKGAKGKPTFIVKDVIVLGSYRPRWVLPIAALPSSLIHSHASFDTTRSLCVFSEQAACERLAQFPRRVALALESPPRALQKRCVQQPQKHASFPPADVCIVPHGAPSSPPAKLSH